MRVAVENATVSPLITVERTKVVAAGKKCQQMTPPSIRRELDARSVRTTWLSRVGKGAVPGGDPPFALEDATGPEEGAAVVGEGLGEGLLGVAGAEVAGLGEEGDVAGELGAVTGGRVAAGRVVAGAEEDEREDSKELGGRTGCWAWRGGSNHDRTRQRGRSSDTVSGLCPRNGG